MRHFDRALGLWREIAEESEAMVKELTELSVGEADEEPNDEAEKETENRPLSPQAMKGSCVLTIRFENHAEYLKWAKYNPGRTWEFLVSYPALMRARYSFENALEAEMMAKKIVQLLTIGFNVYSASWVLEEKEEESE